MVFWMKKRYPFAILVDFYAFVFLENVLSFSAFTFALVSCILKVTISPAAAPQLCSSIRVVG